MTQRKKALRLMNRALVVILVFASTLFCQTGLPQRKTAVDETAMDYIEKHLTRLQGKTVAIDLFGKQFWYAQTPVNVLTFKALRRVDACTLGVQFERALWTDEAVALATLTAQLELKAAELGGVTSNGKRITLRMTTPIVVSITLEGFNLASPNNAVKTDTKEEWSKFSLPASDEEEAKRLGRAFEQQIQACGGKPDRFAK